MSNVITHPKFDRPAVLQPNKRRRRGTINLANARQKKNRHEDVANRGASFAEMFDSKRVPLFCRVDLKELDRALEGSGLCRGINLDEGIAIIMRDPHGRAS
jgi:hypothetical protein